LSVATARLKVLQILVYLLLVSAAVFTLLPFLWMLISSVKLNKDVFTYPVQWMPARFAWSNYEKIWTRIPLLLYVANTLKLTLIITLLQLVTSSLAAYGFAKTRFPGRDILFLCYVATIAIPWQSYMIPQFIMLRRMGLVDTHLALIILQSFTAFGVFLIRQFYMSVPNELCESARIDGLGEYGICMRIMLPLSKPALATLVIISFVFVWNDFLGPLIYINSSHLKTIQLGLRSFITEYASEYNLIMAGSVVALMPVLAFFASLQRFFVEGVATTGLKG
jgi:multiple sugar transport system permease protein